MENKKSVRGGRLEDLKYQEIGKGANFDDDFNREGEELGSKRKKDAKTRDIKKGN